MMNRIAISIVFLISCGGGSDPASPDGPAPDTEPFESDCGFPGDEGNELGIGKFCDSQADCVEVDRGMQTTPMHVCHHARHVGIVGEVPRACEREADLTDRPDDAEGVLCAAEEWKEHTRY